MNPPQPQRWRRVGARSILRTRIFDVESVDFKHPARAAARDFFVINPPDWVNVIALTPDHRLVLVTQFRFGTDDFSLEIPGGVIDPGEDPMAAGVRELEEETGYVGSPPKLLGVVRPNPAMQSNRSHLILIENAVRTSALEWDPDEEFEISAVPVDEVYARAHRGEIDHAIVLNALFHFQPHWERIKRSAAPF